MTLYNVYTLHRDIWLTFEGIEADSPEAAVRIACDGLTSDADDIDESAEDLSARSAAMPHDGLYAPWSLHFDRDGTEDVAVVCDADGDELLRSRHFWLPERDDPIPPTLVAMRLIAAAPAVLAALVDLLGDMPDVQNGRCIRCGREYEEYDDVPIPINCPSDDCPGYQARSAIAEATAGQDGSRP